MKTIKLLKHKNNRDVAIKIIEKNPNYYFVEFYNVNYAKISGKLPLWITSERINVPNLNEYVEIEYSED